MREPSVCDLFERRVREFGARLAVKDRDRSCSYEQLNVMANRIAHALMAHDARREQPVGILLHDGVAMVAALMGVWKAGKIAIPLDPAAPPARATAMLAESAAEIVLSDRAVLAASEGMRTSGLPILDADAVAAAGPADDLAVPIAPDSLAIVTYTSGSTGTPSGVMTDHAGLLHSVSASVDMLRVRPDDRHLVLSSCLRLAGVFQVTRALITGGSASIYDPSIDGLANVVRALSADAITVFSGVTTVASHLIGALQPSQRLPDLRVVALGGEAVSYRDVRQYREHLRPDCLFINLLGSTEAPSCGFYDVDLASADVDLDGPVPIGRPHPNVEIRLVDENGEEVGPDCVGEMVARGRYIARGYWRRPEQTAARFARDPHDDSLRVYHTGDLARRRADGCLIYVGRKDDQVKVRGQRIEPLEIEMALRDHPGVKECAVVPSTDRRGDVRLVAHLVPHDGAGLSTGDVAGHLRTRLPDYMVPSGFVVARSLPRTGSGKIDRRALPPFEWGATAGECLDPDRPFLSPDATAAVATADFVPPRNPTEYQIAEIWEELFRVRPIGANDDFFDLGGDSLLAASLVAALEETCGRVVPPSLLLSAPTVAKLADALSREGDTFDEPITALRTSGSRPPLFFVHNDEGRGLYTHALARALDPDRPCYAVNLHGLAKRRLPASVEAIAADRRAAVRAARPRGPVVLGGHCFGGVIALEMARQLRAQGEDVAAVVLVESVVPGGGPRTRDRGWSAPLDRVWEQIAWRASTVRQRLRRQPATGPYRWAIGRHQPSPYHGSVALFRAEECPAQRLDLGWSALLPHLEVVVVPGDHLSCVTRHVRVFGARVEEVLRRVESHHRVH